MEKSFYDTNMRPFIFYSISLRPFFSKLIINQPTTNPIASLICEIKSNYLIIDQPTTQPIGIFQGFSWLVIFETGRDGTVWTCLAGKF